MGVVRPSQKTESRTVDHSVQRVCRVTRDLVLFTLFVFVGRALVLFTLFMCVGGVLLLLTLFMFVKGFLVLFMLFVFVGSFRKMSRRIASPAKD
jgi:uncharacterized membrane protein